MDKLYIVIPAYNERETIQDVIKQWYPVVEKTGADSRLIIVNDGSKDDTYEIMQRLSQDREQFIPLTKENGGHGATIRYAYDFAINAGADYIFQTDSDGQTLPDEFWEFWNERNNYDMVIGHRNKRQDGFSRYVVTKTLKVVIRICFHVSVTDANTPFRLMNSRVLNKNISLVPDGFNLTNVIISVIYAKKELRVKYIPITFRPRQGGVNSINFKSITKIGICAVKDFKTINQTLKGI